MKIFHVIYKSLKEQLRSFWLLLLVLSMAPFFIFVYYLISETWIPDYKILIVNNDQGVFAGSEQVNHGNQLITFFDAFQSDTLEIPFIIEEIKDRTEGIDKVKNKKADALIIISGDFSPALEKRIRGEKTAVPGIELYGDLTSSNYLVSAVWANEIVNEYALNATGSSRIVGVRETALGTSGSLSYFDTAVPGILIVSLIMLMFTASIAFVTEVENKTILRLKLSKLSALEFIGGISAVQLLVGLTSAILTLITAILLGFSYKGSLLIMIVILSLTTLSMIAFSLIIAAVTKSAGEVLVVGNFPMFLFMFFTGAAFPMKGNELFTIAGYPVTIQGLMTPTHAISALNKTLVMDMNVGSIIPEIIAIVVLTLLYFTIGAVIFRKRHLK
jgi:ABC-2 type transport system permease protein